MSKQEARLPDIDAHARYCDCSYGFPPMSECELESKGGGCRAPEDHGTDGKGIPATAGEECRKVRSAILAALDEARDEALEAAAMECQRIRGIGILPQAGTKDCRDAIRALKSKRGAHADDHD